MEEGDVMEDNINNIDVWGVIDTLSYSSKFDVNAGRADRVFFQHMQEGLQNGELDKIYEFIDAYERGRGLNADSNVRNLFKKAYTEDAFRLCKTLAQKNNIFEYWLYVSSNCDTDMIVAFTKMDVPYPKFYYECARSLIRNVNEDARCEEGIIVATKKIASMDLELWKRWIIKNESNTRWQKIVFIVLSQVSTEAIDTYLQNIHLDMDIQKGAQDVLGQAFSKLPEQSKKYILNNITDTIWDQWNQLIDNKKKKYETLNKLLFTTYSYLIEYCIQEKFEKEENWKETFLKQADMLEKDMYGWYAKQIHLESVFFLDITKIYYLLKAGQRSGFTDRSEELSKCVKMILMFVKRYEYFWKDCTIQKDDFVKELSYLISTVS